MDVYMGTILPWAVRYAPDDFLACGGQSLNIQQYQALYALIAATYGSNSSTTFNLPNLINRVPLGSVTVGGSPPKQVPGPNAVNGATGGSYLPTMNVTTSGLFSLQASNLPGHTHPATFAPTFGPVPVNVSAPAATMNVTIPVGSATATAPTPSTLSGNVYLMNAAANPGAALKGIYQTSQPSPTVNVLGGTASGNPGGSFTGNVTTVTNGTVTVANNTNALTPVQISTNGATTFVAGSGSSTVGVPLPPYLAIGFIIATLGIWPSPPS
jgi:microcystin-dependent protein